MRWICRVEWARGGAKGWKIGREVGLKGGGVGVRWVWRVEEWA